MGGQTPNEVLMDPQYVPSAAPAGLPLLRTWLERFVGNSLRKMPHRVASRPHGGKYIQGATRILVLQG